MRRYNPKRHVVRIRREIREWMAGPLGADWTEPKAAHAVARFWTTVSVCKNGCWEWTGPVSIYGYGRCSDKTHPSVFAHRTAWAYSRPMSPLPEFVCHRCDNPSCVNPQHLVPGNAFLNAKDRSARGRTWRGEKKKRLTQDQLAELFALYDAGTQAKELAARFGMRKLSVENIVGARVYARGLDR